MGGDTLIYESSSRRPDPNRTKKTKVRGDMVFFQNARTRRRTRGIVVTSLRKNTYQVSDLRSTHTHRKLHVSYTVLGNYKFWGGATI